MFALLHRRSLALALVGAFLLTGCAFPLSDAPSITNATQLDDTFTDNQNNWDIGDYDHHTSKIENGMLTINVTSTDRTAWQSPGVLFPEDIDVQADVVIPTIPTTPDWDYAIHVRASGRGNAATFYTCGVSETGHWFISVHTGPSKVKSLKGGDITTRIDPQKSNMLRCVVKGDKISIYFDGKFLGSVQDNQVPKNGNPKYIHLAAYNGQNGNNNLQANFRNLKVRPAQ
jgi:hypothetical protein